MTVTLPEYFDSVLRVILPKTCQLPIVNLLNVECARALLSMCLGYGIIAGSLLVKVPQLAKILKSRSGEGLNVYAVLIDLLAITLNFAYSFCSGFPFSAYGDGFFLAIQTFLIAALIVAFGQSSARAFGLFGAYAALCFVLMGGLTPLDTLRSMQVLNIPILLVGKGIQALTNWRNGSTGQLSAVTCMMLYLGSLARVFTSWQETGDTTLILTYTLSTSANAVIVMQLLWYWKVDEEAVSKTANVKKAKLKSKKAE